MISYYSASQNLFVYVGSDPLPENAAIPSIDISPLVTLRFRIKDKIEALIPNALQQDEAFEGKKG